MPDIDSLASRIDLIKFFKPKGIGVEVGVQQGVFARKILDHCPDLTLYLVDCWQTQDFKVYPDIANVSMLEHAQFMVDAIFLNSPYFDRIKIIKDFSENAVFYFKDLSLDFIYLDGNHKLEYITKDLEIWYPKLKNGGLFAGHDYIDTNFESGYGAEFDVKSAVDKFAQRHNKVLHSTQKEESDFPSWFFIK
jgi:hypothetical protein